MMIGINLILSALGIIIRDTDQVIAALLMPLY